jgi:hypothetical protein
MRRSASVGVFLGMLLSLSSTVRAQERDPVESPLAAGVRSLSFHLSGSGTGSFGYWRMRSERTNIGWEFGLGAQQRWGRFESAAGSESTQSGTGAFVTVGPRFRRYLETDHRVVPFVQTGVSVGYAFQRSESEASHEGTQLARGESGHSGILEGSLGLGAEWFPTSRVSVSGFTGLNSGVTYSTRSLSGASSRDWGLSANTFTSGLSFRIYLMPGSTFR